MMNNQGVLVVVSGFSGAGKGTLMKALLTKYDNYALSISATTRNPREGEEDGREYFFKTREEFEQMIENDELVEYASMSGIIMERRRRMSPPAWKLEKTCCWRSRFRERLKLSRNSRKRCLYS